MLLYKSHLDIIYTTGLISSSEPEWRDIHDSQRILNSTGTDRLSEMSWTQIGMSGKWRFRVVMVSGRKYDAEGPFPTVPPPVTLHSINTGNDEFGIDMYKVLLEMEGHWIKLVTKHTITEMTWDFV